MQKARKQGEKKRRQTPENGVSCPVEKQCGACQLLQIPYAQQLAEKQSEVTELFSRLITNETLVDDICGMDQPYYYRNKVTSPFVFGKKKDRGQKNSREILCGMYAAGSHRVIPTDSCLIENQLAKSIILAIRDLMPSFRLEPYNEDTGRGFLRHAVVRVGQTSGEVLVSLVTNAKQFPRSKDFTRALVKRFPEITAIVQNVNTRQTNVIFGESETTLYGPGFILDKLCGLSFRISSQSFYQVNVVQTEVLYRRAIEMAVLTGAETVIDAYCGTGTIGLVAARGIEGEEGLVPPQKGAARVIGVDQVASAIKDARANARHNGIKNAEFVVDDAGQFMREFASDGADEKRDQNIVFMDPPRAGASEEFLDSLCVLAPQRVVYISCNPQTQARDVAYLSKKGYRLKRIQPVDMFPHTKHVECIVMLSKVEV